MSDQLPLQLFVGWAVLFAFVCAQHQHERMIKTSQIQATRSLLRALEISGLLSMVSLVGILIYYFIKVRWYWVLVLAIPGSMVGAHLAGVLFSVIGESSVSKRGFVGWPIAAAFVISAISKLAS